jgi:hypothetical protein
VLRCLWYFATVSLFLCASLQYAYTVHVMLTYLHVITLPFIYRQEDDPRKAFEGAWPVFEDALEDSACFEDLPLGHMML